MDYEKEYKDALDRAKVMIQNNPDHVLYESDIKTWAEMQGYQKQQKLCPYETNSHRTDIKQLYDALEQMNPEVRYNIWGALEADNKLIEE